MKMPIQQLVSTHQKIKGNLIFKGFIEDKQAAVPIDTGCTVSVVRNDSIFYTTIHTVVVCSTSFVSFYQWTGLVTITLAPSLA